MRQKAEKVEHPTWCDPERCTAPKVRPEKYDSRAMGAHQSQEIVMGTGLAGQELRLALWRGVAPWDTDTFLTVESGDQAQGRWSTAVSDTGQGFALFSLLAQAVGEQARTWPLLYGERFGYVGEATAPEGWKAPAPAEQGMFPEEETRAEADRADEEWGKLPGVTDTYPSTSIADNAEHADDQEEAESCTPDCDGSDMCTGTPAESSGRYRLRVDEREYPEKTLREIQAAVALLVTAMLAAHPMTLAHEASALNQAFNDGTVSGSLARYGSWQTIFGVATGNSVLIRLTREG